MRRGILHGNVTLHFCMNKEKFLLYKPYLSTRTMPKMQNGLSLDRFTFESLVHFKAHIFIVHKFTQLKAAQCETDEKFLFPCV